MNALIKGLRHVYSENGHHQAWNVDKNGVGSGNPLVNNPDIDQLRKAQRVHLSRYGAIRLKSHPITSSIVCEHAKHFWFGSSSKPDVRDIQLHSILVLGLNLGLRLMKYLRLRCNMFLLHLIKWF